MPCCDTSDNKTNRKKMYKLDNDKRKKEWMIAIKYGELNCAWFTGVEE